MKPIFAKPKIYCPECGHYTVKMQDNKTYCPWHGNIEKVIITPKEPDPICPTCNTNDYIVKSMAGIMCGNCGPFAIED